MLKPLLYFQFFLVADSSADRRPKPFLSAPNLGKPSILEILIDSGPRSMTHATFDFVNDYIEGDPTHYAISESINQNEAALAAQQIEDARHNRGLIRIMMEGIGAGNDVK